MPCRAFPSSALASPLSCPGFSLALLLRCPSPCSCPCPGLLRPCLAMPCLVRYYLALPGIALTYPALPYLFLPLLSLALPCLALYIYIYWKWAWGGVSTNNSCKWKKFIKLLSDCTEIPIIFLSELSDWS